MSPEIVKIGPLPWRLQAAWSIGGKKKNKRLLARLAELNLKAPGPDELLAALDLSREDLDLLKRLAALKDAWHSYEVKPDGKEKEIETPARLGLVLLAWPGRKIRLSDAGRFLLSLTAC